MNMLDAILDAQGGGAIRQLGQQFGLNEEPGGLGASWAGSSRDASA
jgi:hypothetical protein